MTSATRDDEGNWRVIAEEGDIASFCAILERQLNALDPVFSRARAASEFEFTFCLLRVRGMEDGGWDPYQTTLRAIPPITELCRAADATTAQHLALWLYGHIFEASEPYELLANLLNVSTGGTYRTVTAFPPRNGRPPSPGQKIQLLRQRATEAGFTDPFAPLTDTWDRNLRNAAFHADYSITREELRTLNPLAKYPWERFDTLINGALAYHTAFSTLYGRQIASYREPAQIAVRPGFGHPELRAVTMVREGYGLIGLKDAWTLEQIRQGHIPFRIGRFAVSDIPLIEADPTLALLPPSA